MLILVPAGAQSPDDMAGAGVRAAFDRLSPASQYDTAIHVMTGDVGGEVVTRQQIIAGAIGLGVGLALARFALGWK